MNKYRHKELSPERAKVWRERSPKYVRRNRKVPVVYYLCRNHQLEHPHFMEVPLSSPEEGLFLRDVIRRLNVLRGRGMASMYSWSFKRSYKNGFVWHDLCEDDLILPAHGGEYILKGSEIIEQSSPGHFNPVVSFRMHNLKLLLEQPSSISQDDTSPSISIDEKEDEVSPPSQRSGSSVVSLESKTGSHSSWDTSLSLTGCKAFQSEGATDASTQTDENVKKDQPKETQIRGVSTDDGTLDDESDEKIQNLSDCSKLNSDTSSSASSCGAKAETLENLIKDDVNKINSFRKFEEEETQMPSTTKVKASSLLMQLISCGSISVKDHSFGLIPMYRPRFADSKFPSPLYSTSAMLGKFNCLSDNSRLMGLRLEDKQYFSGDLVEIKRPKEDGHVRSLKRSSSYNADRSSKQFDPVHNDGETSSTRSKYISRSIIGSLIRQPRSESMRSPHSDKHRAVRSDTGHELRTISHDASIGEPCNGKTPSREDPFREEKIIQIEESFLRELGL